MFKGWRERVWKSDSILSAAINSSLSNWLEKKKKKEKIL